MLVPKPYVVGFLFSEDRRQVLTQFKTRGPKVVQGRLNGIGGKIEDGETAEAAMIREGAEESGTRPRWMEFHREMRSDVYLSFWTATADLQTVKQIEDEILYIHDMDTFPYGRAVPNLRYLLPMALFWLDSGAIGRWTLGDGHGTR